MRMKSGSLLELQFDLPDMPGAPVVNVNVDEYGIATNPRLSMDPCRKNDFLDTVSM